MYELRASGRKKKQLYGLLDSLSTRVREKVEDILINNPYPRPAYGEELCKVEKKGKLYCIEVTGGDRILYDIIKMKNPPTKVVLIHYAGNEEGQVRYLKKYAK